MPLIKLEGFDDAVQRHTYDGDPLPVLYTGPRPCNRCTSTTVVTVGPFTQHALFRDAGHGHGIESTVDICFACGSTSRRITNAVAPPRGLQASVA